MVFGENWTYASIIFVMQQCQCTSEPFKSDYNMIEYVLYYIECIGGFWNYRNFI